jgi:hypothetical protein
MTTIAVVARESSAGRARGADLEARQNATRAVLALDLVSRSLRPVCAEVRDATIEILERTSFADLAARVTG